MMVFICFGSIKVRERVFCFIDYFFIRNSRVGLNREYIFFYSFIGWEFRDFIL